MIHVSCTIFTQLETEFGFQTHENPTQFYN